MRRHALVVVLAVLGAALVVPVALPANGQPKKAIRPADQALARSIVVRRADLPAGTWKGEKSSSSDSGLQCPGFKVDNSDLTETGNVDGLEFSNNATGSFASSSAAIFTSAGQARTGYGRLVRPGIARCLVNLFKQGVGAQAKVRIISAGQVPFPRVTEDVGVYRLVAEVTAGGQKVKAWLDLALLHHGRADAAVIAAGIFRPFASFRPLVTLVARRMAKA